ncbi:MAG TPA: tetratricopeptide repeat protein, partial [Leptospiraceae bacterium]|nr:tetratricopeptide repeat protein [Leptospiraceae bacterium]
KEGDDKNSLLVEKLEQYYSYGQYKPKVRIENGYVIIDIDISEIQSQEFDYKKAIQYCDTGKFREAEPILKSLIKKNPTNSEYYRILGQVYSEQGNQDEAINCLIDSLRWNSKNGWALLLMGNIFSKFKNDISTAMKYYDQSLKVNPNDYIVITNIGGSLMQQGKFSEAKKYFLHSLEINKEYPNTQYALGIIAEKENNLQTAFMYSIAAAKLCKPQDQIYQISLKQAFEVSERIVQENKETAIIKNYLHKLEFECDKQIELVEDSTISTAAKIEFAENHNRKKHILRYKPSYPTIQHLILHELIHLDFVIQARKEKANLLFISNSENKKEFISSIQSTIDLLTKKEIQQEAIQNYTQALFEGINQQIYNTPIDLFIEDLIYSEYPELRSYQFLSIYTFIQEGIRAVTDPKTLEVAPTDLISKSKIFNLVTALHYKDLFGFDLIAQFKPTNAELEQAKNFLSEY